MTSSLDHKVSSFESHGSRESNSELTRISRIFRM